MPSRRRFLRSTAAAAAGLAAGGAGFAFLKHRPKRNVVFVIADALRADRVGRLREIDGKPTTLTPYLDNLKAEGVSFDAAIAPSSWTPISMGSILYGVSPLEVRYVHEGIVTGGVEEGLQHALSAAGYCTASVNGNYVLDMPRFRSGFEHSIGFGANVKQRRIMKQHGGDIGRFTITAPKINRAVESLLGKLERSKSFFLYVHYMDTHEPYYSPLGFLRRLGWGGKRVQTGWMRNRHHEKSKEAWPGMPFEEGLKGLVDTYDASAMCADAAVERLLSALDMRDLLDDTLVVFSSDHGEEFVDGEVAGERSIGHAMNLSQVTLHTPLVLWSKGGRMPGGVSFPEPVSSARVIRDAISRHTGLSGGGEFAGALSGGGYPRQGILSALNFEGFNGASYIDGNSKVAVRFGKDGAPLYKRAWQLGLSEGLREIKVSERLEGKLMAALEGVDLEEFTAEGLDAAAREKLRVLGYLN